MFFGLSVALAAVAAIAVTIWLCGERGHLILPSTRRSLRIGRHKPEASPVTASGPPPSYPLQSPFDHVLHALDGYIYGRWTNQYVSFLLHQVAPRLGPKGGKWLSDRYHAKVLTHDEARAIIELNAPIKRDLEQIVPYPLARNLILNAPPAIAAYECACRHARPNPCQPTQVCMLIGESAVSFMLEHNPQSTRRLTQAEALELLRLEHERGHVHAAWFKSSLGNKFYAICNCCKCCCGGLEQMAKRGIPMVASSGYVLSINKGICEGCATCMMLCPFDAIKLDHRISTLDWEKCMGCGVCVDQCPMGGLTLVRDERKGTPLDVRALS